MILVLLQLIKYIYFRTVDILPALIGSLSSSVSATSVKNVRQAIKFIMPVEEIFVNSY